MIRKKNSFFTFIFSFIPGAGQMYMGFMKKGLSLMSYFLLIIFISVWLNVGPFMLIALIVWFYSFFDTHNLKSTPDDEFYTLEDNYLLVPELLEDISHRELQEKYRNILAVALIIIGFTVLWNNFYSIFSSIIPDFLRSFLYNIGYYLPQMIIGAGIISFGVYLIKGKKQELDDVEDNNYEDDDIYQVYSKNVEDNQDVGFDKDLEYDKDEDNDENDGYEEGKEE